MTVWEEKTEVGGVTAGCYEGQGCARCCDKRSYARVADAQSRMPCSGGRKKGRPRGVVRRVESRPAMRGRAARWWSGGVVRGRGGGGEGGVEGEETAGEAGEVDAGEHGGAGGVEEAGVAAGEEGEGGEGEVLVVGGGGELVGGHAHGLAGGEEAAEGVEEVFALGVGTVDGGGAEDERGGIFGEDGLLAGELGGAVVGERVGGGGLGVGAGVGWFVSERGRCAGEDVVGGVEDEGDAGVGGGSGEGERAEVVGGVGPGVIGLAALDVGGAGGAD